MENTSLNFCVWCIVYEFLKLTHILYQTHFHFHYFFSRSFYVKCEFWLWLNILFSANFRCMIFGFDFGQFHSTDVHFLFMVITCSNIYVIWWESVKSMSRYILLFTHWPTAYCMHKVNRAILEIALNQYWKANETRP